LLIATPPLPDAAIDTPAATAADVTPHWRCRLPCAAAYCYAAAMPLRDATQRRAFDAARYASC